MNFFNILRRILKTKDERGELTSGWFRLLARRAVRKMIADGPGPILDAAGGTGQLFDPQVSRLSKETVILDFDIRELLKARPHYANQGSIVCGDITKMPFPDGTFNTSVCVGTFYNLPDSKMVQDGLCELSRVTKESGRVIVEFRNADNPWMRFAEEKAETFDHTLRGLPLIPYTLSQMKNMMLKAGLSIVRIKTTGIPVKPLILSYILEAKPQRVKENT